MSMLFRKSVIDNQRYQRLGSIVFSTPLSNYFVSLILLSIFFAILALIISVDYSRKEKVLGFISPEKGLVRIIPKRSGTIQTINVKVGEEVEVGQEIISVIIDTVDSQGVNTSQALLEQIELEKANLEELISINLELTNRTKRSLELQLSSSENEIDRLEKRLSLQRKRVQNELSLYEKLQGLASEKVASAVDVAIQENKYLEALQILYSLEDESKQVLERAADIKNQMKIQDVTSSREVNEISQRLFNLEQRRLNQINSGRFSIFSPVKGRVVSLTASVGQSASSQRAIATIAPIDDKLVAYLLMPSRAAGLVQKELEIRLLYDAFPYQKFGFHTGKILDISRSVINSSDIELAPLIAEPVFLVKVKLDSQSITTPNGVYDLQSGMTLQANIVLEERKIWEWLFEPVIKAFKG